MDNLERRFAQQAHAEKPAGEPTAETAEVVTQTIEQIKRTLLDPHAISKKHDAGGRRTTATEISEVRTRIASIGEGVTEKTGTLKQKEQRARELDALKAERVLALEQRLETVAARLKNLFRIKDKSATDIQTEIGTLEAEMDELTSQAFVLRDELKTLAREQAGVHDPKKMLEAYYAKMETMPLSNAEKRALLRPEVLAELSTEEYITLWRRLNPHFLSHVTRQGFRDHNAMVYHSAGLQEFHDGLTSVLRDQKLLRPPMAVRDGLLARDEASIRKFLEEWVLQAENEQEAKDRLNRQLNFSLATAPNYPDKTAVHFAAQLVADEYYGGESNNEVFFLYPSDVLASQHDYAFNGSEKDFTKPQSETKWNDVFVWPSTLDNPGIPVDAGVVFLPKNTPVDRETGSKYASEVKTVEGEEKRTMVEDEKLITAFVEWAENLTDKSPAIQAFNRYKENNFRGDIEQKTCYEVFKNEIMKLGFPEDVAMDITYSLFSDASGIYYAYPDSGKLGFGDSKKDVAVQKLRSVSANWKRAENTITAKEYWEAYFEQHPDQKPKHVVFYDGTPTTAIHEFQTRHNIGQADTSEKEGNLLGFDDRHVLNMSEDPRAKRGYDELVATAHRIIEEHYQTKE
jgi:predicted  nucleic acid-binding Zn-ribbon protein